MSFLVRDKNFSSSGFFLSGFYQMEKRSGALWNSNCRKYINSGLPFVPRSDARRKRLIRDCSHCKAMYWGVWYMLSIDTETHLRWHFQKARDESLVGNIWNKKKCMLLQSPRIDIRSGPLCGLVLIKGVRYPPLNNLVCISKAFEINRFFAPFYS